MEVEPEQKVPRHVCGQQDFHISRSWMKTERTYHPFPSQTTSVLTPNDDDPLLAQQSNNRACLSSDTRTPQHTKDGHSRYPEKMEERGWATSSSARRSWKKEAKRRASRSAERMSHASQGSTHPVYMNTAMPLHARIHTRIAGIK